MTRYRPQHRAPGWAWLSIVVGTVLTVAAIVALIYLAT